MMVIYNLFNFSGGDFFQKILQDSKLENKQNFRLKEHKAASLQKLKKNPKIHISFLRRISALTSFDSYKRDDLQLCLILTIVFIHQFHQRFNKGGCGTEVIRAKFKCTDGFTKQSKGHYLYSSIRKFHMLCQHRT